MTTLPAAQTHNPHLGAMFMAAAMAAYTTNDAMVKTIGHELPLGEILLVRGVISVAIIGAVAFFTGKFNALQTLASRPIAVRAVFDFTATFLFLTALFNMPIANATAILQGVPFVIIVFGAIFLNERIGWRRVAAVAAGFAGVLMVVQPGAAGFNSYSLFALGAMFAVSLRDITTRRIPAGIPSIMIALVNALAVTIGGAIMAVFEGLKPVTVEQFWILAGSAVFLSMAYSLMVWAVRTADVSSTAPFRYSIIIWTLLAGYFVFGEVPQKTAIAGMAVIAACGVYTIWRERQLRKKTG